MGGVSEFPTGVVKAIVCSKGGVNKEKKGEPTDV